MTLYYQKHLEQSNKLPFKKWWKWLVAHSGVGPYYVNGHPVHCGLNLPCGECPGLCSSGKESNAMRPVKEDYLLSDEEYNNGERILQLAFYNDSLMGITFIHNDFVYNDTLFVNEDYFIGLDASELFEKDSIIILSGVYPVTYSHSNNGSTVVNIKSYYC